MYLVKGKQTEQRDDNIGSQLRSEECVEDKPLR